MRLTRATLAVCVVAFAGAAALLIARMPRPLSVVPIDLLYFAFFVGPPAFLGLVVWRRRAALPRPRLLFAVALAEGIFGLAALATTFMPLALLPLVQWPLLLAVWLWLVLRERRRGSGPGAVR